MTICILLWIHAHIHTTGKYNPALFKKFLSDSVQLDSIRREDIFDTFSEYRAYKYLIE